MLRMAIAYHRGIWSVPSTSELQSRSSQAPSVERLFQPSSFSNGHCQDCYGAAAARVPDCLSQGLRLDATSASWLLILRESAMEEREIWRRYMALERGSHGESARLSYELSHAMGGSSH